MPRKLKTYLTSQGFYDRAVAAPSMKAALEAWGANSNLFHQGFAKETADDKIVAATMEKPGMVLQRPVGSSKSFREHADMLSLASLGASADTRIASKAKKEAIKPHKKISDQEARKAAAAFEREEKRQYAQRLKEQAEAARVRAGKL